METKKTHPANVVSFEDVPVKWKDIVEGLFTLAHMEGAWGRLLDRMEDNVEELQYYQRCCVQYQKQFPKKVKDALSVIIGIEDEGNKEIDEIYGDGEVWEPVKQVKKQTNVAKRTTTKRKTVAAKKN